MLASTPTPHSTRPPTAHSTYAAALASPQKWSVGDVVAIAGLIGGIFGRGGGNEIANAALLKYLQQSMGTTAGRQAYDDFKKSNDPMDGLEL